MASRRTSQVTVPRTTRTAAGRRRAAAAAAGALIAAALVGPAPANAGWSSTSPSGGNDPAGYGGAPDATDNGGGGGVPEQSLPPVTARAAIVVDRATGNVLGATNPDLLWAPASTTKMMTGLLASEAIAAGEASLSDTVRIPGNVAIEGGGTIGLAPGDTISLQDLLYIAMLDSKGDAATAIAMHVGGYPSLWSWSARDAFIERMNERAAELGLDHTSFVDVSGRDPEDLGTEGVAGYGECTGGNQFWEEDCAHYSTARDLAALARVLLDDPLLATIVSTPSRRTTTWRSHTGASRDYTVTSTNDLLPTRPQAYPGAYGVKTGTTHMAGEVLVSAAENDPKAPPPAALGIEATMSAGPLASSTIQSSQPSASVQPNQGRQSSGSDVIAVVLGSDEDRRFTDSRALLDFGLHRAP